ncbi:hypothetical protein IKE67_04650 [bacterium]|nr:hypothetical protein [bacterium]
MNIGNISFKGIQPVNQQETTKIPQTGLKEDTFEKKATYNREEFLAELDTYLDKSGKPKYSKYHQMYIVGTIDKNPEKYEAVKNMAALPGMKGKDLVRLACASPQKLASLNEFAVKKNQHNQSKYSGSDMMTLVKLEMEDLERVKPLSNTMLSANSLESIAEDKSLNIEKVAKKANEMAEACGVFDVSSVSFRKDVYDPDNAYTITGYKEDGSEKAELLDKNFNRLAVSETTAYLDKISNKQYIITKTNDYRNNTTSKVRHYLDKNGYPIVESQVRIIKDKNGNVKQTEYMAPSEVKGVYDIKNVYPDGRVEQVSSGKIDKKTGIVSVKRDMKSLDGTRTEYLYENDPQGNKIIDYKITDENGKELLKYSRTFEVIDDNKYITSKNDKTYEVTVSEDKKLMTVKDLGTKEENTLNLGKMLRGDKQSMVNLLKKFPGEELIALKDTTKILKGMKKIDDCCFWDDTKEIDVVDDLFSVMHELGHAKDSKKSFGQITKNPEVQEVYNKERKAFSKAFPNAQRDHINYFIDVDDHYLGDNGGLSETIAEANALLNTYNGELDIAARAQYLQQYFPKTIATLANTFNNQ